MCYDKGMNKKPLAEIGFAMGAYYLRVAGIVVAIDNTQFWGELPEEVMPPLEKGVEHRFFQHDSWTEAMLRYTADTINKAALDKS